MQWLVTALGAKVAKPLLLAVATAAVVAVVSLLAPVLPGLEAKLCGSSSSNPLRTEMPPRR